MASKSFLLICYSFPPYPGTGGRRWAKLAKYLARDGHQLHVVNAQTESESSIWSKDIAHPNIEVHSVANSRPLFSEGSGLSSRLGNKLLYYRSKLKTDGNYADQSLWWNDHALDCARQILRKHTINYLVISCPPYLPLLEFSRLKHEHPGLTLVLDYRDMWIIGQKGKGFFDHLNDHRFEQERQKEIQAIATADCILTVANDMSESIRKATGHQQVHTLTNGYDEEDFSEPAATTATYTRPGKINLLFAGSLVVDSNTYAIPFFDAIVRLRIEFPKLYERMHLCILGRTNPVISKMIADNNLDCVEILPAVSSRQIGAIYRQFDYLLLFLIPYYTYAFISKFFDYLPAHKPIVSVSDPGSFSEYLHAHRLGLNIEPASVYSSLKKLLEGSARVEFDQHFDPSTFSYKHLSESLITLLQRYD